MKNRILKPVALCAILAASLLAPAAQAASTAELVDFGKFEPPASGGEFVEVNIRSNLISLAARLAEKHEPDAAALLRSVHSVRVNVVGVDSENRPALQQRIQQVRTDLEAKGWERVVTARKDQDDVAVYLKMRGDDAIEGLVVTALTDDKEAVFVSVAGNISPEKLAALGEKLNIEPLKKAGEKVKQP